jgi:H+-transporting ATPase
LADAVEALGQHVPASKLVPGDTLMLPVGAGVPADARIVSGTILVDESIVTGESVPVDAEPGSDIHAGARVRRGQAIAEVTATGANTYFGHTAQLVRVAQLQSTEQAAVFSVTRNLAAINGTIAICIVAAAYVMALPPLELTRLALTALLAMIPISLPATFTLSAAFAAQSLAQRGVLLTCLSAAHEAAAMDVLCADKTGTLTRNTIAVANVVAFPDFDQNEVLAFAAYASSAADQDPIDGAIRVAARESSATAFGALLGFVPFDPATKVSEAVIAKDDGHEYRIMKGAFERVSRSAQAPEDARQSVDALAGQATASSQLPVGTEHSLRLAGLIALSDPPRRILHPSSYAVAAALGGRVP